MKKSLVKSFVSILLVCLCTIQVEAKNVIKILAIGNSFSEDAVENYLYDLAKASGDSLVIGNVYIGGCSLERHWSNASSNAAEYSYRKVVGGKKTVTERQTLAFCIEDEPWDYISFQQVSQNSGMYNTYFPFLTDLMKYVKGKATNPRVKFVLHQTWAYASNSTHSGFANYNRNQNEMYQAIVSTTGKVMKTVPSFKFIIPSGTAIQNARTTDIGDHFNRDGYHLELNYGRYTAACTWLEAITGKSPVGNSYVPPAIDKATARIAQYAAHYAIKHPYKVTSMTSFSRAQ